MVSIQSDIFDSQGLQLQEDIADNLQKGDFVGVILDISSLTIVDSFLGKVINNIAAISNVMGAETVVSGMQPAVAITLVELGLDMPNVFTTLTLEKGVNYLLGKYSQETILDEDNRNHKD